MVMNRWTDRSRVDTAFKFIENSRRGNPLKEMRGLWFGEVHDCPAASYTEMVRDYLLLLEKDVEGQYVYSLSPYAIAWIYQIQMEAKVAKLLVARNQVMETS
jgi:hypothetical protein